MGFRISWWPDKTGYLNAGRSSRCSDSRRLSGSGLAACRELTAVKNPSGSKGSMWTINYPQGLKYKQLKDGNSVFSSSKY